ALECGDDTTARRYFKKALELDDEYIDGYNGLGNTYFWTNAEKAKEYHQKAFDLTRKKFNGKWPHRIEWGILENRQYLRSMHGLGLLFWREGKTNEAQELFTLIVKLNPNDNQGARYLVAALYEELSWEKFGELEEKNDDALEEIFERQNKQHQFFSFQS
ncbi:tetratricopeptide repeat protein, partial [Candidatus Woesearchaeota archaeon]|nr:tetratricopeptide repeat protein [Candidatus Woesearchaeota archaeon]